MVRKEATDFVVPDYYASKKGDDFMQAIVRCHGQPLLNKFEAFVTLGPEGMLKSNVSIPESAHRTASKGRKKGVKARHNNMALCRALINKCLSE